jgi:nucleotide-binding universal stress UspA family protein
MADFTRILCPVDFSEASEHAVEHAVAIGRWYSGSITALHVLEPWAGFEPPILFAERGNLATLRSDRAHLEKLLTSFLHPAATARVPFTTRVEQGNAAEAVLKCAGELPADLIVMGSHGRAGFEHLILGSVTEKVLRHAACPVLTVPPKAMTAAKLPFMRLVCAVDFSEPSLQALHVALSMAEESDSELIVLHVIEWPDDETFLAESLDTPDTRRQLEQRALDRLDALIPDEARVWCRPSAKVSIGRAYREIISEAAALSADLIVVGVQGRNAVDLALFGSTANQVARRATCPVLTIRARR